MSSDLLSDVDIWQARALEYRNDPAIEKTIVSVSKKSFKVDLSLITELHNCFPFLRDSDGFSREIRGPADLPKGLAVAGELQAIKDRSAEISLSYENLKGKAERLHDIVKSSLFLKKEVMALKNDAQRNAVVSLTVPEVEETLAQARRVLSAAETVTRNVNQSYNILRLQIDMVKEMMYEAGLTRATKENRS